MSILSVYNDWIRDRNNRIELKKQGGKIRCPNFPEIVSETAVLNVLNVYYNNTYSRKANKGEAGDLRKGDKKIEVKGVSSKGPISFGPKENWDELYILVYEGNDRFSLYQSLHSSESKIWKEMKVSNSDTFEKQKDEKRRPRITFQTLETQIQLRCIAIGVIPETLDNKTDSLEFPILEYVSNADTRSPLKIYSKLRLVDLFCGVGGFHKALQDDVECVLANDFDKECSLMYKANFSSPFLLQDIATIKTIPECDVLTGGFPCQSFSIAGQQKGFDDNRGQLFFQIIRLIQTNSPKIIFLENVKNLITHDEGKTLETILTELRNLNYHVKYAILNASTHGNVPQNRERVFFVGFLSKEHFEKFEFPSPIPLTVSVSDLLEEKVPEKYYYTSESAIYERLAESVVSENIVYQYRRGIVRENKTGVCPTLTSTMGTGGHNCPIILQGKRIRKLTPRECFRLQGNGGIVLPKISDSHLYCQAGNSVCVPVVKRIWKNILEAIT